MKARAPKTVIKPDYRQFRLRKLNTPEFSHIKLLLFWPVFGLAFLALERFRPHAAYHVMHCALDDAIPFSEWALIPYLLWFVYLIGALAYTFFQDVPAFRRMMKFIILTYSFALLTYWLFPNCQHLRPVLSDNDVLTRLVSMLYRSDTNTNVCPSIHVIGSFAVYFAARDSRMLSKPPIRLTVFILTVLISISTVFLKQHSVLDVLAGLLVCAAAYPMIYPLPAHHALPAPAVMQKRTVL
mgnify:CR=1 FL=1